MTPKPICLDAAVDYLEEIRELLDSTTASSTGEVEQAHLSSTNELLTTFGGDDEFSFVNQSSPQELETPPTKPVQKLEVPACAQRAAFKEKVFSFGAQEEPGFVHTLETKLTADLQASAPVTREDPYEIRKPKGRYADGPTPVKEGSAARTPNTNIRLPRLGELPRCPVVSRKSFKASDRVLGCPVPEYADVLRVVQAQLVMGPWPVEMPWTSMLCSLLCWFFPYLLLVAAVVPAAVFALHREAFLVIAPLALALHVLQALRRGLWDRRLLVSVDQAAAADLRDQLRAPLGWGEDGQLFSANLSAALQAFNLAPNALLLPAPGRRAWVRSLLFALFLLMPGAGLRISFLDLEPPPLWSEVALVALCSLILVAVQCRPSQELPRSELVDQRLEALEAGFNAMLDTLRPLLGQSGRPTFASQAQAKVPGGMDQPAVLERFGVRLITAERFTLRGSLTVLQEQCSILVSCPLGDFDLVANGLEGALSTDLGKTAAGEGESMALSPPARDASGWAAALAARFTSREARPRRDDDLASVSTASTLTRGKGQVDEASLHLALAMVAALSRCVKQPLEVFSAVGSHSAVVPPKVSHDEPSLILAMAEDQLSCHPHRYGAVSKSVGCCREARRSVIKERFGVVRDPGEMRQLCTDEELVGQSFTSSSVQLHVDDSPRSSAASQGSGSEDELGRAGTKWPSSSRSNSRYTKIFSGAPRHLALVFDSFAARDRCLELIRQVLPLPTPTASRSKCFSASE
ncbi:hypothetical protein AK812_SmicGene5943 [Symbiodinium microadriaticum]|uniref:Transmembrane protein n=1 Tax=Symbiodinium microadriaticum TaxID=2951 RepID=A0A1Q9ESH5_SYMMI|nr:hypothetical protein AK812_SmicGene5943 [Symbiodinium microadriaticum]